MKIIRLYESRTLNRTHGGHETNGKVSFCRVSQPDGTKTFNEKLKRVSKSDDSRTLHPIDFKVALLAYKVQTRDVKSIFYVFLFMSRFYRQKGRYYNYFC